MGHNAVYIYFFFLSGHAGLNCHGYGCHGGGGGGYGGGHGGGHGGHGGGDGHGGH